MKLSTEAMNTHCLIHNDKQCIHVIGSEVQSIIVKVGGARQHPGRHGAEGAESSTSCSKANRGKLASRHLWCQFLG